MEIYLNNLNLKQIKLNQVAKNNTEKKTLYIHICQFIDFAVNPTYPVLRFKNKTAIIAFILIYYTDTNHSLHRINCTIVNTRSKTLFF